MNLITLSFILASPSTPLGGNGRNEVQGSSTRRNRQLSWRHANHSRGGGRLLDLRPIPARGGGRLLDLRPIPARRGGPPFGPSSNTAAGARPLECRRGGV